VPKPKRGPRLGAGPAHQRLILAGLAEQLIRQGKVRTTEARARALRPLAERMITFAKRGDLAARRQVLRTVRDRELVHKLFSEIAPQYADRAGGYTRIVKLGPRKGDAAPMAIIELVGLTGQGE
jgi:large subunit ribosomal protein L17